LPYFWNAQSSMKAKHPSLWDERRVVFLHFAGMRLFRTWAYFGYYAVHEEILQRKTLASSDDVDESPELLALWRTSFFSLAGLSQYLRVYLCYHSRQSYRAILPAQAYDPRLFEPLSLVAPLAPNNLSTRKLHSLMLYPADHRRLGDMVTLMVVAHMPSYDRHWVGFASIFGTSATSWWEGVNADWTAVEQVLKSGSNQRTMLFWQGVFAGDYWALLDLHHKGLKSVFHDVLAEMGIDTNRLAMPKNTFWPYGNDIIMPHELLRDFVHFVERFLVFFQTKYRQACPFPSLRSLARKSYGGCIGHATERLLHIWAVVGNVQMKFVVEDTSVNYAAGCYAHTVHCLLPSS